MLDSGFGNGFGDTSPAAERVMLDIYRSMSPSRKLGLALDAHQTGRELALAGLRSRHPGASTWELRRRLFALELGEQLACTIYGPIEEAGQRLPLLAERSSAHASG